MSDNKPWLIDGHMYQYDLGWMIDTINSFREELETAIDLKTIHYADPIQWDITTQYTPNTVVIDPKTGTAYMSKVPVPAGVDLKNTNYWIVIFNFQEIYNKIMNGVAYNAYDEDYAAKELLVNDLIWYAGDLYRVTRTISEGSKLIPGTNLTSTTIESLMKDYYGRDRTATVNNDTVTATGDYTVNAGDIATTSDNLTQKVTKDREIDVDGSDSVHVDGASTVNVGGLRTEVYAGDRGVSVNGKDTRGYQNAKITYNGLMDLWGKTLKISSEDPLYLNYGINETEFYGKLEVTTDAGNRDLMVVNNGSRFMNGKWGVASKGRIIIMGDSFAGDWQGFAQKSYADRLCALLGADAYNIFSFGGGGFIAGDNENNRNFLENYKQVVEPAINSVKDEITVFIIQGGLNDGKQNFDTMKNAVTNFLTYVQSSIPDAVILGVTNLGLTKQYHDTVLGINGGFNNAGVRNTPTAYSWLLGRNPLFASDNIHPNDDGHTAIARMIYAWMYGAEIKADDFGYFISGAGGGLTVTPMAETLNIRGYGTYNTPLTAGSQVTVGGINTNLAPANYSVYPIYTDGGLAYLVLESTGAIKLYSPDEKTNGFGSWRVDVTIPLLDK